MTVLLTGGAGFIGSHVADCLLNAGHRVIVIDNFDDFYDPSIKRKNIDHQLSHPLYTLIEGDIRNIRDLEQAFAKGVIDLVIHAAAQCGVRPSIHNPAWYFDININGTISLLEAMKTHEVKKMIFLSSSSVYGNSLSVPSRETDNADRPISPYATTKRMGELLCYNYHYNFNFDIFCLRLFTVYGPRQRPEMAIHYMTDCIVNHKTINLLGDGSTSRDYTYIDDITQGIMKALNRVSGFEIINLAGAQTTSLMRLLNLIENELGQKAIINWQPLPLCDVEITCADISKAKQLLGYRPDYSIEEGIRKFVRYYLKAGQTVVE